MPEVMQTSSGHRILLRGATRTALLRIATCTAIVVAMPVHAAVDPAALFGKKCASCHTYGKGVKVGPDLKGVTDRRSRVWLTTWIRSSERMIKSGDPTAVALYRKFKQERMPDQNFSRDEIMSLLDHLAAAGPEASEGPAARHAITASSAEVAHGKAIFLGTVSPKSGGAPCASCHMVREFVASPRATFGGDLTHIYSRFQDAALSAFLKQPCFPRVSGKDGSPPLTDDEVFVIKAYLRQVDRDAAAAAR